MSNDLYGSDMVSAFELAKRFSKPIEREPHPFFLSDDTVEARDELVAKRKLTFILWSMKYVSDIHGDRRPS